MAEPLRSVLVETLRQAQRFGFFGSAPVEQGIAHAQRFVAALDSVTPGSRVIDLGSGGGLPGLVIAEHMPEISVVLLDRREKRTDFLQQAVARLGMDHVTVVAGDAHDYARQVEGGAIGAHDAVTARGFGPPEHTLRTAVRMLRPTGIVVISEPPSGNRWNSALLRELGMSTQLLDGIRRFTR